MYKSGPSHGNADALTRLPLPVTTRVEAEESVLLLREVEDFPPTAVQISNWAHRDPVLANVKEYLLRGWPQDIDDPELIPYKSRKNELSVQDGCVLWGAKVVIPLQGRKLVLAELHPAQPGICRMKSLARSYVWWPSLDRDLQALVQSCEVCQVNQKAPAGAPSPSVGVARPTMKENPYRLCWTVYGSHVPGSGGCSLKVNRMPHHGQYHICQYYWQVA